MKYFVDTEFLNLGASSPIRLLSIGIVSANGRELYRETPFSQHTDGASQWMIENVYPHFTHYNNRCQGNCPLRTMEEVRDDILSFIGQDRPQFCGYYCDFDYVCLSQLFGTFADWPEGWPTFMLDVKQYAYILQVRKKKNLPKQEGPQHNALDDARWTRAAWEYLEGVDDGRQQQFSPVL